MMSGSNIELSPPQMIPITIVSTCLPTIIIAQTFLTILIPLLVALFYFSTPYSRRQPIFILNVLALTTAITMSVTAHTISTHLILSPQKTLPAQLVSAEAFLGPFQGMLADTILFFRLIAVYPLSRVGLARFALLTSLPITLKIVRMVNLVMFTIRMCSMVNGPNAFAIAGSAWLTGPYMKVEWVAQVVDNSYASMTFLWTLRRFSTYSTLYVLFATDDNASHSPLSISPASFAVRIRILFNFALSNFIIPTVTLIVLLAFFFRFGDTDAKLIDKVSYVNSTVAVLGVVFATVWAGKGQWREADIFPNTFPVEQEQRCVHELEWGVESQPSATDITDMEKCQNDVMGSGTSPSVSDIA